MMKALTFGAGTLALALAIFSSASPVEAKVMKKGSPSCTSPDLHTSFGEDPSQQAGFVNVHRKVVQSHGHAFQWVAVLFEGPPSGSVYVFDCQGHRLANGVELGEVEQMAAGPLVRGLPTLEVRYVPGSGTGIHKWERVSLLQFHEGAIATLWKHDSAGDSSGPGAEAGTEDDFSERYRWRYLNEGSTILVTGTETEDDVLVKPARHVSHKVRELYCLTATSDRYVKCSESEKAKVR